MSKPNNNQTTTDKAIDEEVERTIQQLIALNKTKQSDVSENSDALYNDRAPEIPLQAQDTSG